MSSYYKIDLINYDPIHVIKKKRDLNNQHKKRYTEEIYGKYIEKLIS